MKYLITEASRFKSLKLIRDIQEIIEDRSADGYIDLAEYEPEQNPSVGDNDGEHHLVEVIYNDKVYVMVYDSDGVVDEYFIPYEELELDVLEEILDLLNGGIEEELI